MINDIDIVPRNDFAQIRIRFDVLVSSLDRLTLTLCHALGVHVTNRQNATRHTQMAITDPFAAQESPRKLLRRGGLSFQPQHPAGND